MVNGLFVEIILQIQIVNIPLLVPYPFLEVLGPSCVIDSSNMGNLVSRLFFIFWRKSRLGRHYIEMDADYHTARSRVMDFTKYPG